MNQPLQKRIQRIVNLTRHDLNLYLVDGEPPLHIPKAGTTRVGINRMIVEQLMFNRYMIGVNETTFYSGSQLPKPQEGTIYVISSLSAKVMTEDRDDVYIPDEPVKNERGKVIGCKSLALAKV